MSKKSNKQENKQQPLYAKVIAAGIVGVLVLITLFGTVAILMTQFAA